MKTEKASSSQMVSVIIPTKGRAVSLEKCLSSLVGQIGPEDEILIVDGDSGTEQSFRVPEDLIMRVKILKERRSGLSVAFNTGAMASSGELLVFMNDDVIVSNHWMDDIRNWAISLPQAAAFSGVSLEDNKDRNLSRFGNRHHSLWRLYDSLLVDGKLAEFGVLTEWGTFSVGTKGWATPKEVSGLAGPCFAVRRNEFNAVKGFDERLKTHNSDGLLFIRLREAGFKLFFVPGAQVFHFPASSGATRDPFNLVRDTYIFTKILKPTKFRDRIRKLIFRYSNLVFWPLAADQNKVGTAYSALRGFVEGIRLCKLNGIK